MRALIADDDRVSGAALAGALRRWGLGIEVVADGQSAWDVLKAGDPPSLAVIDWMMPGLDGIELCRRIRRSDLCAHMYVILLTARGGRSDIVAGLNAGADDYLVKPFDSEELRARINTGIRILGLQARLTEQVAALQASLASIKQLKGLLPICSYCKRIRDDQDYWQQLEGYISDHSDAHFSHGICPACFPAARAAFEAPA